MRPQIRTAYTQAAFAQTTQAMAVAERRKDAAMLLGGLTFMTAIAIAVLDAGWQMATLVLHLLGQAA